MATPVPPPARTGPRRDLRELAWLALEGLITGELDPRRASALATIGRLLVVLGPDAKTRDESLLEVERRALLMAGLPPSNAAEWAWARENFTAEAVQEFERWAAKRKAQGAAYRTFHSFDRDERDDDVLED